MNGFGSWLSDAIHTTVGWVAGHGNVPGTPDTRKYGYDPNAVSSAVVADLQAAPQVTSNPQGQLILLGLAGLGVLLLASHGKTAK